MEAKMTKEVKLDEFFIALVLSKEHEQEQPNERHLERLRLATIHYLVERLKCQFPKLSTLEMKFKNLTCGSQQPEPRFQVYWEVDSKVHFTASGKLPKPEELFKAIGPALDQQYFDYLRSVLTDSSPLAAAEEVTVRQVKPATAGGAVKAPPFYMSFVATERPDRELTEIQIEKLVQYSHPKMTEQLKSSYPEDFQEMTLRIVKTEINENARKPVDTFNVYVEFEAVGTFTKNAPAPMQFFADLASFSILDFLLGVGSCLSGYFEGVTRMAINPCAWVENEVEELDDPDAAEDAEVVPVHVEFWVALVIPNQRQLPSKAQNEVFDKMIKDQFVSSILTKAYGAKKIVELDVAKDSCEFQAGVPLPRFNVLHRYQVDILMTNPIPLPSQILSKIVRSGNLLGNIIGMPAPWNQTTEVTLGVARNETPGKEQAFGSKIQSPPKPVVTPPVSPKPTLGKPRKKKKPKSPQKTTIAPLPKKTKSDPPKTTKTTTIGADVFLALTVTDEDGNIDSSPDPTTEDYKKLEEATFGFYTEHLRKLHGDNFLEFHVSVRQSLVNGAKPDNSYNIYVEWHLSATFADSTKAPSRVVFCQHLVDRIDTMDYLKNRVRSLAGTPFAHAFRIYTEQLICDK